MPLRKRLPLTLVSTIATLLLYPASTIAGGMSWQFTVRSIEHHVDEDIVVLDQTCEERDWIPKLSCDVLVLYLKYKGQSWSQWLFGRDPHVTEAEHNVALTILWSHLFSGEVVSVGEMGSSFRLTGNDPCVGRPDALEIETEIDGGIAVYAESQDD